MLPKDRGLRMLYIFLEAYNPFSILPTNLNNLKEGAASMSEQTGNGTVSGNGAGTVGDMETLLDLDTVENMNFDSIEDAPGFVVPPNGVYLLQLDKATIEKYKTKAKDGQPAEERKRFSHYYSILDTLELEDAKEQSPKIGDKFSERFMFNEKGLSYWKTKAKDILGNLGQGVTVANVLKELNTGTYSFTAKITNKKSKGTDGKEYTNTQVRVSKRTIEPELP